MKIFAKNDFVRKSIYEEARRLQSTISKEIRFIYDNFDNTNQDLEPAEGKVELQSAEYKGKYYTGNYSSNFLNLNYDNKTFFYEYNPFTEDKPAIETYAIKTYRSKNQSAPYFVKEARFIYTPSLNMIMYREYNIDKNGKEKNVNVDSTINTNDLV